MLASGTRSARAADTEAPVISDRDATQKAAPAAGHVLSAMQGVRGYVSSAMQGLHLAGTPTDEEDNKTT